MKRLGECSFIKRKLVAAIGAAVLSMANSAQTVVVVGGDKGWDVTLDHREFGYLYPSFNARNSYNTPNISGFNVEVDMFDRSRIKSAAFFGNHAIGPDRVESESSYATFGPARFHAFVSGLYQDVQSIGDCIFYGATCVTGDEVDAWGAAGGIMFGWDGLDLTLSGYTGEALGGTVMLDGHALDPMGKERERDGWLAQATYTFNGQTKLGGSYGESYVDETDFDRGCRTGTLSALTCHDGSLDHAGLASLEKQRAWTVGVYHDVTSWFKMAAEYTNTEREWQSDAVPDPDQESNVFAIGGFVSW
jgi:predicted porin